MQICISSFQRSNLHQTSAAVGSGSSGRSFSGISFRVFVALLALPQKCIRLIQISGIGEFALINDVTQEGIGEFAKYVD